MKGYLIDAPTKSITIVEVAGVESAKALISKDCKGLNEILSFRNGDTVFADNCGFYPELDKMDNPETMGMITSDTFINDLWPFFNRILILGCSIKSNSCTYENPCDVKSTEEQIMFWTKFFPKDEGMNWLAYNFMVDC